MRLKGKASVITGGANGIGREAVLRFAEIGGFTKISGRRITPPQKRERSV